VQLKCSFRLMALLDVATGLHRSELFALRRSDVDFSNMRFDALRSVYLQHVRDCKTEASRKPVPVDERTATDLWVWRETTGIGNPTTGYSGAPYSGKTSVLARCVAAKDPSPGGIAGRDQQENYIARLSTHLLDACDRQQREREGDPGIDAARQQLLEVRRLFPGADPSEAPTPAASSLSSTVIQVLMEARSMSVASLPSTPRILRRILRRKIHAEMRTATKMERKIVSQTTPNENFQTAMTSAAKAVRTAIRRS
jgi:integrase